jgi:hypothetical protein
LKGKLENLTINTDEALDLIPSMKLPRRKRSKVVRKDGKEAKYTVAEYRAEMTLQVNRIPYSQQNFKIDKHYGRVFPPHAYFPNRLLKTSDRHGFWGGAF